MLLLHEDPYFTFRFADARLIPRIHLEGVEAERRVSVFRIDPSTGERQGLLATGTVGDGGWIDFAESILVRAGEAFIAVLEPGRLNPSPGKMLLYAVGAAGGLGLVGYLCGLAQGGGNQVALAVCCSAVGGGVVLLGYGPFALVIGAFAALPEWFQRKKR